MSNNATGIGANWSVGNAANNYLQKSGSVSAFRVGPWGRAWPHTRPGFVHCIQASVLRRVVEWSMASFLIRRVVENIQSLYTF